MKLPRTSVIVATLTGLTAPVLALVVAHYHWTGDQVAAVSGAAGILLAFLGFVVEHVRKETPSRWVGVFGLIPGVAGGVAGVGYAFAWWTTTPEGAAAYALSIVVPVAALFGVVVAQSKVTSPETLRAEVAVAQVSHRRGGEGSGIPPA